MNNEKLVDQAVEPAGGTNRSGAGEEVLLSEMSRPKLVSRLRMIFGLFVLCALLFIASVHWLAGSVETNLWRAGVRDATVMVQVREVLVRLNYLLLLSGLVMVPVSAFMAMLASRFVNKYFSEMETFNRRKSRFVSMVAHELRTPLNSIKGFADLMDGLNTFRPGSHQEEYLAEIRGGAGRLKAIVNDLLDLSRIEAGRVELVRGEFAIGTAIDEGVRSVLPQAGLKKIEVKVTGDGALRVVGDALRTRQVASNLLSNAVKFSPHSSVVDVLVEKAGPGFIKVSVSDTGGGIPSGELSQLFEEFRQTRAGKEAVEGTGLGLAISKKLVIMQGGVIKAENGANGGAVFSFTVPSADAVKIIPVDTAALQRKVQAAGEAAS